MTIRPCRDDDDDAVLSLLEASLGWVPDDDYRAFFEWKHRANPFGRSPAWVAVGADGIIGFRTFLRWEFDAPGGRVQRAVRAVDTATHPAAQGKGVFSRLTLHALDELARTGTEFVFNTPNDASRPGYVKMGWCLVGRLPVAVRPRSPASLARIARSRVPAAKWSEPSTGGVAAEDLLTDEGAVAALLASQPAATGLRTARSPEYLRWRYGFGPLRYRAVTGPSGVEDGVAVFRTRRRGASLEAALCEVLAPGGDRRRSGELAGLVAGRSGADAVLRIGRADLSRRFLPVPGQGPTLVWRGLDDSEAPTLDRWQLQLGDVELF